jgi:eukaryotic-like serine/threonine-protein kinase
VYALNAKTGKKLWRHDGGDPSPAVANGVVYIGTGYTVDARSARTGALLWRGIDDSASSPAAANGVVYIAGGRNGSIYALNAKTGKKLWSYMTTYGFYSSPAVANGMVYIGSGDPRNPKVYAFGLKKDRK